MKIASFKMPATYKTFIAAFETEQDANQFLYHVAIGIREARIIPKYEATKLMRQYHAQDESNIYPINIYKESRSEQIEQERYDEALYRTETFADVFGCREHFSFEPVKVR